MDGSSSGLAQILLLRPQPGITDVCTMAILRLVPDSPSPPSLSPAAQKAILAWYADHGRRLAFRETADPYAILVSEAMAQQTQAARAADHWMRFLRSFPTVVELAAASPADVQRAWRGLGYNRRALALWRAARVIVAEHGGRIPDTVEQLERLPGVGPYTARAVAAIAFGRPVGAVDVNIRRVIGRTVAGGAEALPAGALQAVANASMPPGRAREWTYALMDVGATVCRPRAPRCDECPVRPWCRYTLETGAGTDAGAAEARTPRRSPPFPSTNRWLRGRILDRLRQVPDDRWVVLDEPIGMHDRDRVLAAARALSAEGLIEVAPLPADDDALRARLATA
jgi:A/G-specific adenine glycosylase